MKNYSGTSLSIKEVTAYEKCNLQHSYSSSVKLIVLETLSLTSHYIPIGLLFRFMLPLNGLKNLRRQGMYLTTELLWHERSLCNKK